MTKHGQNGGECLIIKFEEFCNGGNKVILAVRIKISDLAPLQSLLLKTFGKDVLICYVYLKFDLR
jgi:hypothetical protein